MLPNATQGVGTRPRRDRNAALRVGCRSLSAQPHACARVRCLLGVIRALGGGGERLESGAVLAVRDRLRPGCSVVLRERLCHQQWEHKRCFSVDLDGRGRHFDLAPGHGLVRAGPGIRAVVLVARVDEDRVVGAIAHQVGVAGVVLDHAAAQNDHAAALGAPRDVVDAPHVLSDVHDEALALVAVVKQHVADGAVGEGRTEDGDVVARRPVPDGRLVLHLFAHALDDLAGRPDLARLALAVVLLVVHAVQHGDEPLLERHVVQVRHQQVARAVDPPHAQGGAGVLLEVADVVRPQRLHDILLHRACGRDDGGDHAVLRQIVDDLTLP